MKENPDLIYSQRLAKFNTQKAVLQKRLRLFTLIRILSFLLIFIGFYIVLEFSIFWAIITAAFFLGLFLFFVKQNISSSNLYEYTDHLAKINQNERLSIKGDYSVFSTGKEYISKEHDYTFDLDIFGEGSLYQYLNRSSVKTGGHLLADNLQILTKDAEVIRDKQEAINELAAKIGWRQDFMATGKMSEKNDSDIHKLNDWLGRDWFFKRRSLMSGILILLSVVTVLLTVLSIMQILPYSFIGLTLVYEMAFYTFFAARINKYHVQISKYSTILNKYAKLLSHIENENWTSGLCSRLSGNLKDKRIASYETKRLSSLVGALDSRLSFFLALLLNWFLQWDLQCIMRMEKWKKRNKDFIEPWFSTLAKIDSLQCFGNYKYNNPSFVFPEIEVDNFIISSEELGHPLIIENERVCNGFTTSGHGKFSIITGANMAGKSTFLRTVGINLILAMNGAPVCAQKFVFTPISVFSSMRTDDSLQRHKSYFFSELERLKTIFDKINGGEKLFLILDEILKGTNSKDKEIGSKAFLKKLIKLEANGVIATHDLSLGELEEEFPKHITNQCFEVKITEKELEFDYKLYPGITKNLNASYLLKKMGIV